ncbi:MAG: hypothetical protein QME71_04120 [Dehalococcoidia bacterium]|nr:hypothetical protein [Dehalococcoidia bacterium]
MKGKLIKTYSGGQPAPEGIYLKKRAWDLTQLPEGGGHLPDDGAVYYRVPLAVVMVLGPIAGLAFILFLPVAVMVFAVQMTFRLLFGLLPWRRASREEEKASPAR